MSEQVPEGWEEKKIGDSLVPLPKSKLPSGVSEKGGYYDFYVCSQDVLKSFHNEMSSPTILFSTGGEAAVHYATGEYSYSTDVWATKFSGEFCNEYAYRLLEENLEKINYSGFQGSGIKHLDKSFVQKLTFAIPPLPEQKKIASILTSVDEVIEKTQSQIDKLQDLKKGTMNELLTKGIGHTEFKDSELGRIPKSWEVKKLSEFLSKNPKNGFSPKETENGDLSLGLGCLTKDGFLPKQLKSIVPSERNKDFLLKDGDFLISRANTRELVGLVGIFQDFGRWCIYPDLMMRLTFKKTANVNFILQMLLCSALRTQISSLAQGTSETMVKLNSQIVKDIRIPVPTDIEQDRIIGIISPINKCLSDKKQKLHQTQSLKKSLMQDLLTGKVRVSVN